MPMIRQRIAELLAVSLLTLGFAILYVHHQPQILAGGGYGWDGIEYAKLYRQIAAGSGERAGFPFCNRVGTPFLSSLTGLTDVLAAFKAVNLACAGLFSVIVYLIGRAAGFHPGHALLGWSLTVIPFFAPLRFTPFYPVYTDPPFLMLLALAVLALLKNRFGTAFLLVLLSVPVREAGLYVAPLFLGAALVLGGLRRDILLKFGLALAGILAVRLGIVLALGCTGSQWATALSWARRGLSDPQRFVSYAAALSMTAAPVLYLRDVTGLSRPERLSALGLVAAAGLAFLGGSDATRIFYSFLPMYVLAVVAAMRSRGPGFSALCLLGYGIVNRFGARILEPLQAMPAGDESGLFWQFPDHARPEVGMLILWVWGLLFAGYDRWAAVRIGRRWPQRSGGGKS